MRTTQFQMNRKESIANGQQMYAERIKARLDGAFKTQGVSKELEGRETALLERLQRTY